MDKFQASVDVLVLIFLPPVLLLIVIILILCFYRLFPGKNSNVADIVQYFFLLNHFFPFRLGQVRLGQVRLGQIRLGQVRLGQVRLGQVRLGQVRLGQIRLGQVRLGQVRLGQVRLGQIRLGIYSKGKKVCYIVYKGGGMDTVQFGGGLRPPFCPLWGQKGGKPRKSGNLRTRFIFFFTKPLILRQFYREVTPLYF